jgi:hypothetical protein
MGVLANDTLDRWIDKRSIWRLRVFSGAITKLDHARVDERHPYRSRRYNDVFFKDPD